MTVQPKRYEQINFKSARYYLKRAIRTRCKDCFKFFLQDIGVVRY